MARKRMIDPGIWESEDFSELDNFAKLIWIGLFSQADDEGRGRCKPVFLRSLLFPYSEDSRLLKNIDNALNQIAVKMSIKFYQLNDNEYYQLLNWSKWQKIDKPNLSKIPAISEDAKIIRRILPESSPKDSRTITEQSDSPQEIVSPNIKEQEKKVNKKESKNTRAHACEDDFINSLSLKFPHIDINTNIPDGNYDFTRLLNAISQSKYLQSAPLTFIFQNYDKVINNCYKTIGEVKGSSFEQRTYTTKELNSLFTNLDEEEL